MTKTHINKIDKEYIDYIENIDHDLVSAISYYRMTNINLLADVNGKKQSISSSSINMSALPKNLGKNTYIKDNYDLLAGKFSENKNEVVLVLDSKNRIDTTLLDALGIDSKVKKVSYNELIGKEFKIVKNNDYYINLGNDTYIPNQNYEELYNNENNITIKIVGIIRGKKGNKLANIMTVMAENMGMNLVSNIG